MGLPLRERAGALTASSGPSALVSAGDPSGVGASAAGADSAGAGEAAAGVSTVGASGARAVSTWVGAAAAGACSTGAGAGAAGSTAAVTGSRALMAGGGGGMALAGRGGGSVERPLDDTTRWALLETGTGSTASSSAGFLSGSAGFLTAAFFADFLGGGFLVETTCFGASVTDSSADAVVSSGGLTRPSRLAFLRTRSACASTMLDE